VHAGGVPHIVGKFSQEIMGIQSDDPNFKNFETLDFGVSRKMTFGCSPYD
jgi:hypothetical protein